MIPTINPASIQPARGINFTEQVFTLFGKAVKEGVDCYRKDFEDSDIDDLLNDIVEAKDPYFEKAHKGTFAKFIKDVVNVDIENFDCAVQNYKGIEYASILTGGDYEVQVIIFAYIDVNGDLRAYVPFSGNYFNHDTWSAINHSDDEDDRIADIKFLINNYPELTTYAKANVDEWDDEEDNNGLLPWAHYILDYAVADDYVALEEFEGKCDEALS